MVGWGVVGQRQARRVENADLGAELLEKPGRLHGEKAAERPRPQGAIKHQDARCGRIRIDPQSGGVGNAERIGSDMGEVLEIGR